MIHFNKLFKFILIIFIILGCKTYRSNQIIVIDNQQNLIRIKDISYIKEIDKKRPNFKNGEFNIYLDRNNLHNATVIANDINLLFSDSDSNNHIKNLTAKVINSKTIKIKIPLQIIEQDKVFDFIADIQKIPMTDCDSYVTKKEIEKRDALLNKK